MTKNSNRIKTFRIVEKSNVSVDNPTSFGPSKIKITIPKGTQLKVKEVK